ncbi:MAG: transglutaminase family protein [Pseudomonadota bacterium]|nr:transglutaminase family protein [Pseudomonadota bacterium]
MRIHAGYDIAFDCSQPTPMLLQIAVHPSRVNDMLTPGVIEFQPPIPLTTYIDGFGNCCTRIVAPAGRLAISTRFDIQDSGAPDPAFPDAMEHAVQDLPDEVLVYLLGSRYCDTDRLTDIAWSLFGTTKPGWSRVQAICDFVHQRIKFNYMDASVTRTAWDGYQEQIGVCRDYAHLAIALTRCMNIPARYCTGYLGDMGTPPPYADGDFSAWFEAYLGGEWRTFDARFNVPRIGRVLIARGRDATDCAISTTFGKTRLAGFTVITDEVTASEAVG